MKVSRKTAQALEEVAAFEKSGTVAGRVTQVTVDDVDVKLIRERLQLSQEGFAEKYGFPLGTLKNWEQGRREPEGAAKLLLRLIDSQPKLVERAIKRVRAELQAS